MKCGIAIHTCRVHLFSVCESARTDLCAFYCSNVGGMHKSLENFAKCSLLYVMIVSVKVSFVA